MYSILSKEFALLRTTVKFHGTKDIMRDPLPIKPLTPWSTWEQQRTFHVVFSISFAFLID